MLELSSLLPGTALWALALYLPLSLPLGRLEEALSQGPLWDRLAGRALA